MRSSGLVLMGVAALLVVGYAFYVLLTPAPPRAGAERSRAKTGSAADSDEPEADRAVRPRPKVSAPPADRAPKLAQEPAQEPALAVEPGLPPRPTPEIPLDEARKQFADYMAELDDLDRRGVRLTSPEWVEHYKRGHEVLLPLQQHLDWQVPAEADELHRANEDMRTKVSKLDPGQPPRAAQ